MRKFLVLMVLSLASFMVHAQGDVRQLVREGIALHDKGDYEGAIARYDEALKIDNNDFDAHYEKSLSCLYSKKYDACVEECKLLLDKFGANKGISQVYSNYGSALDDKGEPDEAVKIYNKGIKKFPGFYLLHFNKGLTLTRQKKYDEALECYTDALRCNGLHAGSNYYTGLILQNSNRVPSLLAFATLVALEPQGERAKIAAKAITEMFTFDVKKEGNNTTITLSADMFGDKKSKKGANDFTDVERGLNLMGALTEARELDSVTKTEAGKFDFRLQILVNMLTNNQRGSKGFYWDHYVPFFIQMKENGHTLTLANLIYMASDTKAKAWVSLNEQKVRAFYSWMKDYDWKDK